MTKKELLEDLQFSPVSGSYNLFWRNFECLSPNNRSVGLFDFATTQVKGEIRFVAGLGGMTKDQILNHRLFKKVKNDYIIVIEFSDHIRLTGNCEVRVRKDGYITLKEYTTDRYGNREY